MISLAERSASRQQIGYLEKELGQRGLSCFFDAGRGVPVMGERSKVSSGRAGGIVVTKPERPIRPGPMVAVSDFSNFRVCDQKLGLNDSETDRRGAVYN